MIITLICIGISVIFGILFALITTKGWDLSVDEDAFGCISVAFAILALICGIVAGVINIAPEVKAAEWEEHICYLENQKEMLESVRPILDSHEGEATGSSDIYFHFDNVHEYYNAVDEYNKEVEQFITNIKTGKLKKNNPWINWFVSNAYNMIDLDRIESLRYSKGKVNN